MTFTFERFRKNETQTVTIKARNETAAYKKLFVVFPEWGKGLPLRKGKGWSSALLKSID